MMRIPLVDPKALTPFQRRIYEEEPVGRLAIFRLVAHAADVHPSFSTSTDHILSSLTLASKDREIIILAVSHLEHGRYVWAQHVEASLEIGVTQAEINAIAEDRFGAAVFDTRHKALLAFVRQVVEAVRVDDYVFEAMSSFFNSGQIVEAIYVIGTYMMILRLAEVAELEVDGVHGADVVRAAMNKRVAQET